MFRTGILWIGNALFVLLTIYTVFLSKSFHLETVFHEMERLSFHVTLQTLTLGYLSALFAISWFNFFKNWIVKVKNKTEPGYFLFFWSLFSITVVALSGWFPILQEYGRVYGYLSGEPNALVGTIGLIGLVSFLLFVFIHLFRAFIPTFILVYTVFGLIWMTFGHTEWMMMDTSEIPADFIAHGPDPRIYIYDAFFLFFMYVYISLGRFRLKYLDLAERQEAAMRAGEKFFTFIGNILGGLVVLLIIGVIVAILLLFIGFILTLFSVVSSFFALIVWLAANPLYIVIGIMILMFVGPLLENELWEQEQFMRKVGIPMPGNAVASPAGKPYLLEDRSMGMRISMGHFSTPEDAIAYAHRKELQFWRVSVDKGGYYKEIASE